MKAVFEKLIWEKGQAPHLEQGIKDNKRPKGAKYGGHGSFMVAGESAKLYLFVKGDDGKIYNTNIYHRVMQETGRQRMSQQLYDTLYQKFLYATFTIYDNSYIEWNCNL